MTTYQVDVTATILDGTSTVRTETKQLTGTVTEEFWAKVKLPAAASDTALILNLLTDPKLVVLIADGSGVSCKLDSGGTDSIGVDGATVITNETDGLAIDRVLLSNAAASEREVIVIAIE
jgi:hypothetical protein